MKAVEKNISRHANGTLYFVSRRNGHLIRTSLGTKKLEEARRAISRMLADRCIVSMTAREPQAVSLSGGFGIRAKFHRYRPANIDHQHIAQKLQGKLCQEFAYGQ